MERRETHLNRQPQWKEGKHTVIFSPLELQRYEAPLQFALIAKFSKSRSRIEAIRHHISTKWGLSAIPIVSFINRRNVLIELQNAEDFSKTWTRDSHSIEGSLFQLFKWSRDFNAQEESPVTPVWIRLPFLPLIFCIPSYLHAIVKPLGKYLDTDLPTIMFTRPSYARVCVEIDISAAREDVIWIGSDNGDRFWQEVVYERSPKYCVHCRLHGHEKLDCKRLNKQHYNVADFRNNSSVPDDNRNKLKVDTLVEGENEKNLNDANENGKNGSVEMNPINLVAQANSQNLSCSPTTEELHDVGQEEIMVGNIQTKDKRTREKSLNKESEKDVKTAEIGAPLNGDFHPVRKGALASPQNMIPTREMDSIPIDNSFDALVDTLNLEAPWQTGDNQPIRPERDEIYHLDSDTPDIRANNRHNRKLSSISDLLVRDSSKKLL